MGKSIDEMNRNELSRFKREAEDYIASCQSQLDQLSAELEAKQREIDRIADDGYDVSQGIEPNLVVDLCKFAHFHRHLAFHLRMMEAIQNREREMGWSQ
ncbi:MAG: hypothetical protein L0Z62_34585 [Gemmataceae bacterium]|nr:hypothetical protein [Gemmataceae bacterium]